jgi:Glycosyl hydrolase family 26
VKSGTCSGNPCWWGGFSTSNTTFDLEATLADTTLADYKYLIADIDTISMQLAKLRDAGIPVLWRPLHEAEGAWFWWGAKGATPLKKLWNIVYDRMTVKNKLTNLIWVWTSGTSDATAATWYPGHDRADIIGMDAYVDSSNSLSSEWKTLVKLSEGKKLVAMSECGQAWNATATDVGALPRPGQSDLYQTWWSYSVPWSGTHIHAWPTDRLKTIYNSDLMITKDELPDWSTVTVGMGHKTPAIKSFDVHRTSQGAVWTLAQSAAMPVRARLLDLEGRTVSSFLIPAGATTGLIPTPSSSSMNYLLLELPQGTEALPVPVLR